MTESSTLPRHSGVTKQSCRRMELQVSLGDAVQADKSKAISKTWSRCAGSAAADGGSRIKGNQYNKGQNQRANMRCKAQTTLHDYKVPQNDWNRGQSEGQSMRHRCNKSIIRALGSGECWEVKWPPRLLGNGVHDVLRLSSCWCDSMSLRTVWTLLTSTVYLSILFAVQVEIIDKKCNQ